MDENNFDDKIQEIKEQIKPSEELINKTILKVRKIEEERTFKKAKRKKILTTAIASFTTLVIFAEGASFAFRKQDILSMLFSNIDKGIETAIEYGDIKNVDMDYIEIQDGLKMKVEFVLMNEYNFDLVFKFDGLDEFCEKNGIESVEKISFEKLHIKNNENTEFFSTSNSVSNFSDAYSINLNNSTYLVVHSCQVTSSFLFADTKSLNIDLEKLIVNNNIDIENNYNFDFNVNSFNIDNNKINYKILNKPEYIEKYNIILSSTNLKVELFFNEKYSKLDKNNCKLKDNHRNIYSANNDFIYGDKYLLLTFPISNYQDISDLKLYLNLNNKTERIKLVKK